LSGARLEERPEATIVVYPHYFSGSKVPGMDAEAREEIRSALDAFFHAAQRAFGSRAHFAARASICRRCASAA